jgi:hypothetical protein
MKKIRLCQELEEVNWISSFMVLDKFLLASPIKILFFNMKPEICYKMQARPGTDVLCEIMCLLSPGLKMPVAHSILRVVFDSDLKNFIFGDFPHVNNHKKQNSSIDYHISATTLPLLL